MAVNSDKKKKSNSISIKGISSPNIIDNEVTLKVLTFKKMCIQAQCLENILCTLMLLQKDDYKVVAPMT